MTTNSYRKQSLYLMYLGLCLKTHFQKIIVWYLIYHLKYPKELQKFHYAVCSDVRKNVREKKKQVFSGVVIVTFLENGHSEY